VPESGPDRRFFARSGRQSLAAVAEAAGIAAAMPERMFDGVAPLQTAGPSDVSFLDNRKYLPVLAETRAGAVIVRPDVGERVPRGTISLATDEPYLAWARIAALFHPPPPPRPGVSPAAVIDPTARIDPTAEIGPLVVVGAGAEIGARARIGPAAVIGEGVVIGPDCRIGAHASISHALVGARVYIYPGARLGQEGFGFAATKSGFVSVPQLGRVIVEDGVEIGANSTVDRGSAHDTIIGAGSRLDNLVQIGHNVRIGRACVIIGQAGVSGSTILEDQVVIAGQAGLIGHIRIGRAARIGAQAGVMSDVAAGAEVIGSPAQPATDMFRQIAVLRQLARKRPDARPATTGRPDRTDTD